MGLTDPPQEHSQLLHVVHTLPRCLTAARDATSEPGIQGPGWEGIASWFHKGLKWPL